MLSSAFRLPALREATWIKCMQAFPLIDGASQFAAAVLGRIGQRVDSAEGRPIGSLVQVQSSSLSCSQQSPVDLMYFQEST
jgi:hypothetical protein